MRVMERKKYKENERGYNGGGRAGAMLSGRRLCRSRACSGPQESPTGELRIGGVEKIRKPLSKQVLYRPRIGPDVKGVKSSGNPTK